AASMALADGVLKTMLLKKLTVAGSVIASLGLGAGTGTFLMRYTRAQDSRPAAAANSKQAVKPADGAAAPKQPEIDPLPKEPIDAASQRLKAQTAYYELGRIPLDRLIAASENLERVELLAAKTEGERRAIRLRRANLARDIERREEAELKGGRGTEADMAEA